MIDDIKILYELLGQNKYQWLRSAKQLIAASNILNIESNKVGEELVEFLEKAGAASEDEFIGALTYIPAKMLTGMAIENLIKGLIIMKYPEKVSMNKKFDLNTHKLSLLWETHLREIPLEEAEKEILKELENYISWKGKYPIPLYAEHFKPSHSYENETLHINSMYKKLLEGFA